MGQIKAKNIKIVPIEKLVDHPRNNNTHSDEQIDRLAKLLKHQGFREPLTVSNRSGFIVCGHARKAAAIKAGFTEVPVCYQDFESEAEEYQHLTAENEIARWAVLDHDSLLDNIKDLDLGESDFDLFGIPNLELINNLPEIDLEDDDKNETDKKWAIQAEFPNEMEMRDYHDDLLSRGFIVKVL